MSNERIDRHRAERKKLTLQILQSSLTDKQKANALNDLFECYCDDDVLVGDEAWFVPPDSDFNGKEYQ